MSFILYHWSPKSRRGGILRRGLRVGSRHAVHSRGWRADYLCYSDSPSFGWAYSANTTTEEQEWDLWMVWSTSLPDLKKRFDHKGRRPAEYRSKRHVPKSEIWHVGSRTMAPRKRRVK